MHALEDEKDRKTFPFIVLANKVDMLEKRVVRIWSNVGEYINEVILVVGNCRNDAGVVQDQWTEHKLFWDECQVWSKCRIRV